jgi:hypothetical protein
MAAAATVLVAAAAAGLTWYARRPPSDVATAATPVGTDPPAAIAPPVPATPHPQEPVAETKPRLEPPRPPPAPPQPPQQQPPPEPPPQQAPPAPRQPTAPARSRPRAALPIKQAADSALAEMPALQPPAYESKAECRISVGSYPWSELWVDGADTGQQTPVVGLSLPCGHHRLQLKRRDLKIDQVENVTLNEGNDVKRNYELQGPGVDD